jgi:phage-related protein
MAIGQSDGSIILTTEVDKSGIKKGIGSIKGMAKTATKAFLAVGAAAATATIAIAKASVDAFADYEQLVGGVETLFKGSSKKLIEYANEAFRTSGLSANEFMSTVTSFSASLISSLGGDTEKAADIANKALIDMSDNANKMGTSLERIQMAYQSFARGQYQLLDNLALGYGGTKSEMERLLKDAQAITGVKYDISKLADVYTAIGVIQEKLGIAGTTAKEAATTISGSAATMRAAWQNVLTAISGGGDLDNAINNLVDSISVYFENIVPVVERSMIGIGALIEKVAPMLVQTVAKSLIKAIPSLLVAVYEMIIGLARGIYQGIIDLFSGTTSEALTEQAESIEQGVKNQNDLTKAVEETNEAMKKTTASFDTIEILSAGTAKDANAEPIIPEISEGGLGESLEIKKTKKEMSAFEKALKKSFDKISKTIKKAWNSEPVQAFWEAVKSYGTFLLDYWTTLGTSLCENLKTTWGNIKGDFNTMTSNMSGLWTTFWKDVQVGIDTWGQPIIDGVNGVFNSIWTTAIDPYIQLMVGAWSDFTRILKSKWEEYGQPLINNIGQFSTNVIALFKSIYDNVLEPIITPFLQTMSSLWDEHISVMIEKVVDFVMKLENGAFDIYNKFIHPIVMWFTETLEPTFTWIGNAISGTFQKIVSTVSGVLGGVFDALGGLIDFISGAFTGDWKKAWSGIKSFFVGIWDAIWASIKNTINSIIDGLNTLWGGLYSSLAKVINGVGGIVDGIGNLVGKDFGWSIPTNPPKIPKLAQGAVIPPNKEFLAVLGDQKHGMNIEAPLSTIQDAVQMVVSGQMEEMSALLSSSISVQREILEAVLGIEIGDDVIGNAISRYQRKMTVIHGG